MSKLLLVDGYSILNRGFYALPLLTNGDGVYTNAIHGFMNILFKTLDEERPDSLVVALDCHAPTFRHKLFAEYKGTRKGMPEELKQQLPVIREVLASLGITYLEKEGFEADDILGTLARRAEAAGMDVTLLSGDRDLLQIASDRIKIAIPKTQGGKTETAFYYAADLMADKGVTPSEFIEVKALMGDSSDNIPGVTKVGEKTALKLIQTYHSLEGVYDHIDEISGKALVTNLVNDKESAFLSRTLATINTDAPVETDLSKCPAKGFLKEGTMDVLLKYGLKSAIAKLKEYESGETDHTENETYRTAFEVIEDFNEALDFIGTLKKQAVFGMFPVASGIAFSLKDKTVFVKYGGMLSADSVKVLGGFEGRLVTYRIKRSYDILEQYTDNFEDVEILAYLIDAAKGDYPLSYLAARYLKLYLGEEKALASDEEVYACTVSDISLKLFDVLYAEVAKLGMEKLYREMEMPLSFVLYSMEKEGVLVDKDALKKYSDELATGISELERKIYDEAGTPFNINSPKQLGEVLFEKMGLPGGKKTKSGYSTAADVLEKLAGEYPIVSDVLEYRALSKLKSTYADGLTQFIAEDGRIHTNFNQTVTATGRISSSDPNLQNIPIRTELGRRLRKVFYPRDGFVFIDADYSQIELRLMAHMSGDEKLIDDFKKGRDIHRSTAASVFNVPLDEVTDTQRRNAKAVNFGIIYGISSFGLSRDIDISRKDAQKYIDDYYKTYPKVKEYLDGAVASAKNDGFSKTMFDRIRPIPEIKDSNFMVRSFGERVAMNAPIQGTAADIMKIAMIKIFNALKNEGLASRMLIQVHDEVLIEVKKGEEERVLDILKREMEGAVSLSVPLLIDAHTGNTWYDAK